MPNIDSAVQKKLDIKWVDAKTLVQRAAQNCEITNASDIPADRVDEVTTEACEIFQDLDDDEKDRMRVSSADVAGDSGTLAPSTCTTSTADPEWQRKAREQAERKEAEWQAKEAAVSNTTAVRNKMREKGVAENEVQGTKVMSVRSNVQNETPQPDSTQGEEKPVVRMTTHTCFCIVQ